MSIRIQSPRERIAALAAEVHTRFVDPDRIDDVALTSGIVLVRNNGPIGRDAGFAHIHSVSAPVYVESLAHPGELSRVWGRETKRIVRSIAINPNAGIPEREIFWHEYYHLFYSPQGIQHSERFAHAYSTEGVLHHQEERRADEFASAVLVHPIEECDSMMEIAEKFGVSERIAMCAFRFARQLKMDRSERQALRI